MQTFNFFFSAYRNFQKRLSILQVFQIIGKKTFLRMTFYLYVSDKVHCNKVCHDFLVNAGIFFIGNCTGTEAHYN